jgi:SAM-dependent methyltransferase
MSDLPKTQLLAVGETLHGYDRWAAQYDHVDNPMVAATEWALDARPLDVRGRRVVELGCGTGRHAARVLAGDAASYVGVDGSAGMLEKARARVTDPRCRWIHADFSAHVGASFGASFDVALVVLVLEHLTELAAPFAAMARALVPGGRLRIVDLHPARVASGTAAHFSEGETDVRFASFAHEVGAIRHALGDAGFVVERVDEDRAEGALLTRVPRLAKYANEPVVLDVVARRS